MSPTKIAELGDDIMVITARAARSIRHASKRRSQSRDGLGISELFLAPADEAHVILEAKDVRLKLYLFGYQSDRHVGSQAFGTS